MCRPSNAADVGCPIRRGYLLNARANGRRRRARLARRKVADYLREQGLCRTAAVVLESPPSMLAEFITAANIPVSVLGDTPMPAPGPAPAPAQEAVAASLAETCQTPSLPSRKLSAAPAPPSPAVPVAAAASQRLAEALARVVVARPAPMAAPNCGSNFAVILQWEDAAEVVFAETGSKQQCRRASAEAEMLCKGCPLAQMCAAEAKDSHYSGIAGGRIFVNGRARLTPSRADRIVA